MLEKSTQFFQKHTLLCIAIILIGVLSLFIFIEPESFYLAIEKSSLFVREWFGDFYLWLGLGCVLFLLVVAFSPMGKLRLGGKKPEYRTISWVAMLYSAGMGAGILLRAVQEPVFMQQNPPIETGNSPDTIALEYTFYQWGLTAWAFYGFFALVMGYYLFIRKKNMVLSVVFQTKKEGSAWLQSVDLLTILTTVIGIVAAIGLGASQIDEGIKSLFSPEKNYYFAFSFTLLIFMLAFISAYQGINKGIKVLSNLNIGITVLLFLFIFFQSDILLIFKNFISALYNYIIDFIPMSLAWGSYDPGKKFLTDWTYYYWAFWIAWAPFTGIFIARISRGRTIRQMILGALLIPSLGSFFWFSVFGTSAFEQIQQMGSYQNEFGNVFTSIFIFLKAYPLATFTSIITILLLVGFLVTSVDSAIFVLSMFTDQGKEEPAKKHRLIWAVLMFLFTEAILILGSFSQAANVLTAMQKLLIITSLPFAMLFTVIAYRLISDYRRNKQK